MRRGTTLLEMMVVGVLLMALIGTITSFFTYMPRWFATTSRRLDVGREEAVASAFLERDLAGAASCDCPAPDRVRIVRTASPAANILYFTAPHPDRAGSFELRRSIDGTTTNFVTVAREVRSLACTAQPAFRGADVCLVYNRDQATRRARFQWRATIPRSADLALGDWDSDGRVDAAAVSVGVAQVDILENQPEGTLTVTRTAALASGTEPRGVVTADFNRDGRPDLAVLAATEIQLLEQTAPFTFGVTSTFALPATTAAPRGLATGDFDRDGIPDLAVSDRPGRRLMLLFGGGDFSFAGPVAWPGTANLPGVPGRVRVADVNRDGIPDVVVALSHGEAGASIAIGLGQSNRTAAFDAPIAISAGAHTEDLDLADLNRDGLLDLASTDRTRDRVALLTGMSVAPFFAPPGFVAFSQPTALSFLNSTDAGASAGFVDLAVAGGARHGTASLSVYPGQAAGTFGPPAVTAFPLTEQDPVALVTGPVTRTAHASVVAHWMTPDPGGERTLLAGLEPTAGELPYRDRSIAVSNPSGVAIADFDRNAAPDVVFAQADALMALSDSASPSPTFSTASLSTSGANHGVTVADFDRDGIPDLATTQPAANRVCVLAGPLYNAPALVATGLGPQGLCAGDFDRDGIPDLVVAHATAATVRFHQGPAFTTPQPAVGVGAGPTAVVAADFNRDGKLDVAVACAAANEVRILLGQGNGAFTALGTALASTGGSPRDIAAGDLDRDGIPDLAIANKLNASGANGLTVFLGLGNGSFSAGTSVAVAVNTGTPLTLGASGVRIADADRDGFADLIWCGYSDDVPVLAPGQSKLGVAFGQGDGTFPRARAWDTAAVTDRPDGLAVADVNRDGKLDCVLSHGEVHFGY